jgi:hypothetical protein
MRPSIPILADYLVLATAFRPVSVGFSTLVTTAGLSLCIVRGALEQGGTWGQHWGLEIVTN